MTAPAQTEPPAGSAAQSGQAPAPSAAPQGQWVVERPAPGLARGKYPWPEWGVAVLGGLLVTLGLVYLGMRLRRLLRR